MTKVRQLDETSVRRLAVANLLRVANADLADAQLLLKRSGRNAAVLASQALGSLIRALAVSEYGAWPVEDWNAAIGAIPAINPLQEELACISTVLDEVALGPVQSNGQLSRGPDVTSILEAMKRLSKAVKGASEAFDVDLAGTSPARHADRLRPAPVAARSPTAAQIANAAPSSNSRQRSRQRTAASSQEAMDPGRESTIMNARPRKEPRRRSAGPARRPIVVTPGQGRGRGPVDELQTAPHALEPGPEPIVPSPHHTGRDYSSTVFWTLMDRWKLADLEALDLIGHSGGLTKKGTRPRFRVMGREAELFGYLQEIDTALAPLVKDRAAWIRQPIRHAPFRGANPLRHITRNGIAGARDVARELMVAGLKDGAAG